MENDNVQELLAQAPPNAPDASNPQSAAAAREAESAKRLADSLTTNVNPSRPAQSGFETPPAEARPGSFGAHLATALQEAKKNVDPKVLDQPGGWAKLMVGTTMDALSKHNLPASWAAATSNTDATQPTAAPAPRPGRAASAIDNIMKSIGDVSAATEQGGAGGALGGFVRTAAATSERHQREAKDRQLMATSNAQMLHEQALTHKLGEESINASIKDSTAAMDNIINAVPGGIPGTLDMKDKTSDDLKVMIDKGELDPTKQTVFLTGRTLVGKDPNGLPLYRSTYSVVTPAGDVHVSPENAKLLNQELGRSYSTDPGKPQTLPAVQLNHEIQQALNTRTTRRALQVAEAKDDKTIREAQTSKDAESIYKNPIVMKAIEGHMTSPDDPFAVVKAYNAIMNNDKLRNDPSMPKNFTDAYIQAAGGTAVWDKKVEEYAKAQQKNADTVTDMLNKVESDPKEIEGHTPAFTAAMKAIIADPAATDDKRARAAKALETVQNVRQLELELEGAKEKVKSDVKTQAGRGPESDKIGEEFLATLPRSRQNIVKGIGLGQIPASPSALERTDKGQALLSDIYQTYPDFDASKGESWYKNRNEYMGSGPTAKAKINYNTALEHLKELYNTSTLKGMYDPLSKDWRDRQAAFAIVTGEVGKAIKTGVITEGEGKELRKALGGWTPADAKERATEVGKLLKQKIDQFQEAFNESAPSKMISVPTLISRQAQEAYDFVQSGGKPQPAAKIYKPGDPFMQNGHQYKVTTVDDKGNVTGAE